MKYFASILLGLFIALTSYSQKSNLTVFSESGELFHLTINGIQKTDTAQSNVKIKNLDQPRYSVKIEFKDKSKGVIDKNVFLKPGMESVYAIKMKNNGRYVMRWHSESSINGMPTPTKEEVVHFETEPDVTVKENSPDEVKTGFKRIDNVQRVDQRIEKTEVKHSAQSYNGQFVPNGTMCSSPSMNAKEFMDFKYNLEEENMFKREDAIENALDHQCFLAEQIAALLKLEYSTVDNMRIARLAYRSTFNTEDYMVVVNTFDSKSKRESLLTFLQSTGSTAHVPEPTYSEPQEPTHYQMPGYTGAVGCDWPASDEEYSSIISTIENQSFSDTKLNTAKQFASSKCLTVDQVKGLMEQFSFEDTKLEFAKYAYEHTYDIDNYFKLNDAFSFESSVSELQEYIQNK
ncbi:MAG: DUF4476 domain-containing protein [Salibacter sp.]|uniref:DUF4476 domain-containing protein n=1 Tax=Salibacter sp. TaxID=2010995 RepID=UPI00287047B0|nr:DUF4476 domain-containing protein [Salibacter sp.]MDR9397495.1 DUF4476 domain-containing protein [Salibacter sp.]